MSVKGNLMAGGATFLDTNDLSVHASRQSHYNADFGSLRVEGFAFFTRVRFDGEVSFRNAQFSRIYLDEVIWPTELKRHNTVRLEWLRYDSIQATTSFAHSESNRSSTQWKQTQAETWKNLRPIFAAHTPYSDDVYTSLENYFRKEGAKTLAREVGFESAEQYRKKVLSKDNSLRGGWSRLVSGILKWTVGHGYFPERALAISAFFVLLGAFVFRRENMQPNPGGRETPCNPPARFRWMSWAFSRDYSYHSFWYSLDMFVPIIDLKANDDWMPKLERRGTWHWLIVHRTLGAILVPIGLAAFAGIIK